MKKILVVFVIMAVSLSGAFANGRGDLTTIEGKLTVHESLPAVDTGEGLWLLPSGPFYRIAWENGVSRGDSLVVKGFTDTDKRIAPEGFSGRIMPVEVSVNGKSLEVDRDGFNGRYARGRYGPGNCERFSGRYSRSGEGSRRGYRTPNEEGARDRGRTR